jgi:MoaA/NifB/PqqE/SkfB family radical SAM enzyme
VSTVKPTRIRIDASSYCQLRCPGCPVHSRNPGSSVSMAFLKPGDFKKLIDQNPQVRMIELSNYGELFLNPELPEIMKCASERGVILCADNGVNLNHAKPDVLESLVKYRFRSLTCSVDGASDETYRIYRVGGDFSKVIENIRTINTFKEKYRSSYPHMRWQMILFGHCEQEIPAAKRLAAQLGMTFRLKLPWDSHFSPVRDRKSVEKEIGAVTREEYRTKYGRSYTWGVCHQLWHYPQINSNGDVLGCSCNFWGDFGGNAFRDGLLASLNADKMMYARDMLLGRKAQRADIPCAACSMYAEMKSSGRFLRERPAFPYRLLLAIQHFVWMHPFSAIRLPRRTAGFQ